MRSQKFVQRKQHLGGRVLFLGWVIQSVFVLGVQGVEGLVAAGVGDVRGGRVAVVGAHKISAIVAAAIAAAAATRKSQALLDRQRVERQHQGAKNGGVSTYVHRGSVI